MFKFVSICAMYVTVLGGSTRTTLIIISDQLILCRQRLYYERRSLLFLLITVGKTSEEVVILDGIPLSSMNCAQCRRGGVLRLIPEMRRYLVH